MKFDKIEAKISQELNERCIQPNEKSWDRLDAMLSLVEVKKPKQNFRWLYLAASVVGILFVVTFYFNQDKKTIELDINLVTEQNLIQNPTEIKEENNIKTDLKKIENTFLASKKTPSFSKKESEILLVNEVNNSIFTTESIASVKEVDKKESNHMPEISVDQLLTSITPSIANVDENKTIKINAKNLLNQVDDPIKLSFKDRAIITIAENYKSLQTAIAHRNQ